EAQPPEAQPAEALPPTEVHGRASGGSGSSAGGVPRVRPEPPNQIGPYRILDVLGQGGMGTVYLAQQDEPLRRRVALKIIRTRMASEEHHLRFAAEQQALARMSHPYVAQVFDAGTTEEGEPYFVMERVAGDGIVRFCDIHQLTVRQRLELFAEVCDGVEHAHQKGLIHRDLKPSNILITEVEGRPTPKIIDFGVAKALDQPLAGGLTRTEHSMLGTPGYWSPESAAGSQDHDTRTDVYSLGLTLYDLLAGTLPFPPADESLIQLLRRVAEEDAPPMVARFDRLDRARQEAVAQKRRTTPAALRRDLGGDLTWIVARAIRRDKEGRYPSASALKADVLRHLDDLPIEAGPPRSLERFGKLVRRHRAAVAATLLVVLSLLGGLVARTAEARRANREAARANREAQRANEEAARASREAQNAERVSEFLIELFEINEPGQGRGDQITAREMLDRGAEKVRAEVELEPLTRAALLDTVGSVYGALGRPAQGEPFVVEALEIRRQHLGAEAPEVAESLVNLTQALTEQARFDEAEVRARELLEISEARVGSQSPELAEAINRLAIVLHNQGELEESVSWQERAIDLLEAGGATDEREYHVGLNHLGTLLLDLGRQDEAIAALRKCLEVRERLLGPGSDDVAQTLNNLGLAMLQLERFEEGIAYLQRSVEIREQVLGPDHPNLVWGLRLLGQTQTLAGAFDEAEGMLQRCLVIQEGSLGRRHPFTAMTLEALANLRRAEGRLSDAEAYVRESLSIADERLSQDHPSRGYYLHTLGNILRDAGRQDEALASYQRAIELMSAAMGAEHPAVQKVEADMAQL
ncbi:MAG: serine/threonine-protein kinase, partial [Acidobacteriota bacterium]